MIRPKTSCKSTYFEGMHWHNKCSPPMSLFRFRVHKSFSYLSDQVESETAEACRNAVKFVSIVTIVENVLDRLDPYSRLVPQYRI